MATKVKKKDSALIRQALEANKLVNRVLEEPDEYSEKDFETILKSLDYVKYLVETHMLVRFG